MDTNDTRFVPSTLLRVGSLETINSNTKCNPVSQYVYTVIRSVFTNGSKPSNTNAKDHPNMDPAEVNKARRNPEQRRSQYNGQQGSRTGLRPIGLEDPIRSAVSLEPYKELFCWDTPVV